MCFAKRLFQCKRYSVAFRSRTKTRAHSKIHVNQFNAIGGVQVGVKYNALSVDHLEVVRLEDIEALKNTSTIPVALPNCSHFIGIPFTPARALIEAGLPLALASDYNPGSAPSGNMNQVTALGCIKMKMTPEEAINAATINGAMQWDWKRSRQYYCWEARQQY